jgi:hypothetical protein
MKPPTKVRRTQPVPPEDPEHGVARLRHVSEIASKLSSAVGPFGASVLTICATAFLSIEFARTDTQAAVIGAVAVTAIIALSVYFMREPKITSGPLSPP